jgi:hypothetical protein
LRYFARSSTGLSRRCRDCPIQQTSNALIRRWSLEVIHSFYTNPYCTLGVLTLAASFCCFHWNFRKFTVPGCYVVLARSLNRLPRMRLTNHQHQHQRDLDHHRYHLPFPRSSLVELGLGIAWALIEGRCIHGISSSDLVARQGGSGAVSAEAVLSKLRLLMLEECRRGSSSARRFFPLLG